MKNVKAGKLINLISTLTFVLMIAVNALAEIIPLNGVTTGEVSDMYPNLFTPAPYTFLIWGIIYILLTFYLLFQLGILGRSSHETKLDYNKIGLMFSVSSLANAAWIFAWHYDLIWLSVLLMFCILIPLILISLEISNEELTPEEKLYVKQPFSVYFGWITVATIANITTLLVSIGWNGFGIPPEVWTVMILFVGTAIGVLTLFRIDSIVYGLTLIWAYIGILVNQLSSRGLQGRYPGIIITVVICILIFAAVCVFLLIKRLRTAK